MTDAYKIEKRIRQSSTTKTTITLTKEGVLHALRTAHPELNIPDNARVSFVSPRGGDYSGMTIDVDRDNPVTVQYTVEQADVSPIEEIKTTSSSTTPWKRRELEQQRVSQGDNDDAKMDLVARALGLDSDTATTMEIEEAFAKLCARVYEADRREREAST